LSCSFPEDDLVRRFKKEVLFFCMAAQPRQLVFELPHRSALGAEDFLVSPANTAAVGIIDSWPDWPHGGALVVGPVGCGKSHLANVWCFKSDAANTSASKLDDGSIERLQASGAMVVEDLDRGIKDERVLFHLLNLGRQEKSCILLTSRVAPGALQVSLPDLRSRLRALPVSFIEPPDENLLQALLVKLFEDRQIKVEPSIIGYLSHRMERSMEGANAVVEAIDRLALETHRRVTRPLAHSVLTRLGMSKD